ncbi:DUF4012 domain-containing protein [Patescibacteria group bacterium]|nr:DUF4012 domain-containing protein [Patescibacteria group bacterium]MBU1673357.1 DUF4012 domain-containing protein [Patescibacteria group bacterium]MBU1963983.1 DUF4012 domain-containing protein [Patescibacteria group bacterium]
MPKKEINNRTQISRIELTPEDKKKLGLTGRGKKWMIGIGIFILVAIIAVAGVAGLSYGPAKAAYKAAMAGKQDFEYAQVEITNQNFDTAIANLESAGNNFRDAKKNLDKISWMKYIPYVGTQVEATDNLIIAAINISDALEQISDLGLDILAVVEDNEDASFDTISPEQKQEILQKIYESPPDIQGAKAELDLAVAQLEAIPDEGLMKPLADAIAPIKEKLPLVKQLIEKAVPMIEIIPSIAGYPEEKTYLFLLQNNNELRPTGGFIGTYGILKVKDGEMVSFFTDNIYAIDVPAKEYLFIDPPQPYQDYLGSTQWFMRDSNWDPGFPETAQQVEEFYHLENGPESQIDGVIAVDPVFIGSLLELTGPINVDDIEFTAENFVDQLQYQVEIAYVSQGVGELERKEIIGRMASTLMDRMMALPKSEWGSLWEIFARNVDEKHILLYLKDDEVQEKISEMNWAGEIKETMVDYLMVVDSNLGALKTDKVMEKTITYNVYEENGDLIADLNIHYKNNGTITNFTTRYRTYTRVYAPLGSELIESSGTMQNDRVHGSAATDPDVYEEHGKTVFGGFTAIEPMSEGDLHYKYKLPAEVVTSVNDGYYNLYAQKQPGTIAHPFLMTFDIGQNIQAFSPLDEGEEISNNKIQFNTDLRTDRRFEIEL